MPRGSSSREGWFRGRVAAETKGSWRTRSRKAWVKMKVWGGEPGKSGSFPFYFVSNFCFLSLLLILFFFFFFVSVNQSRGIWSRAWVCIVQPEEVTLRAVRPRDHPSRGKVWGGRARGTFYSQRSTTSRRFLVRSERVGYLEGQGTQKTDFSFYFYLLKVKFLCRSFRFNFLKYFFFFFLSPLLL